MKKQNVRTLFLIVVTLAYLFAGAAVFETLELSYEQDEYARLRAERADLCERYNISEAEFRNQTLIVRDSEPHQAGLQWKFTGAIYFATTVITTIGERFAVWA